MRGALIFLLCSISWAAEPQVEVRNNEVWLIHDGQARQLTRDGRSKLEAVLSPSANQIAYYEQCPQEERCLPSIVILDLEGKRQRSFHVVAEAIGAPEPCASLLGIYWLSDTRISAECHINPSLSEYVETDLRSGKTVKDLLGYGFMPSPDGKYVAHVAPYPHFAPPIAQSNYLQIDKTTIYPLPNGTRPTEEEVDVVRRNGSTWLGVHEFAPKFFWSPDSERLAFVDCVSDWVGAIVDGATLTGHPKNRRCFAAVVTRSGRSVLLPLRFPPNGNAASITFSWDGPHHVAARIGYTAVPLRIQ
jgi:hypothetical protein